MWKYIKESLHAQSILSIIAAGWLRGMITTAVTSGFSWWAGANWWWVGFGGFVAFVVGTIIGSRLKSNVEFYQDRQHAPHVLDDIKKAREVWISLITGEIIGTSGWVKDNNLGEKITRLILLSPDGDYLKIQAKMIPNISESKLRMDIKTTYKRLKSEGLKDIRYFDGLMASMVICNPSDDKKGFIRVELWSPKLESSQRHIYYIYANKHKDSFIRLRNSYSEVWEELNG